MENISFKYKGDNFFNIMVAFFGFVVLFFSWIIPASSMAEGYYMFIAPSILYSLPFFGLAIFGACDYQKRKKRYYATLNKYGEENLRIHLTNNTLLIHNRNEYASNYKTYFTDKLIIIPGKDIVTYEEIAWMYRGQVDRKNEHYSYISLRLYNGSEARVCLYVEDTEIMDYFNFIYMHNNKIIFQTEFGNSVMYHDRVYGYKRGVITYVDPVDISVPIDKDEYDFSGVFPKKKGRFDSEEELEEYIEKNYTDDKMEEAIDLYTEETSMDTYSAAQEVERIFEEREEKGMKLKTPYEFTKEAKRYKEGQGFIIMGVFFVALSMLLIISFITGGVDDSGGITMAAIMLVVFFLIGAILVYRGVTLMSENKKED